MSVFSNKVVPLVGLLGSVFAKRDADGKIALAVGPWAVVAAGGLILGCGTQDAEPFSQCVVTIGKYLMGA